jgi:hypothetical protein
MSRPARAPKKGPSEEGGAYFEDDGRNISNWLFKRIVSDVAREERWAARRRSQRSGEAAPPAPPRSFPTVRELGPMASVEPPPAPPEAPSIAAVRAQRSLRFTNGSTDEAAGLELIFAHPCEVFLDPATGNAGPFQDVAGNGTRRLVLSNPERALGCGVSLTLKLRSRESVRLLEWGWIR